MSVDQGGSVPVRVRDSGLAADRHALLVQSSLALFLENGFHRTTIRQIAEAVGWQMGTLYLYIRRKEDVLFLVEKHVLEQMQAEILGEPLADADPKGRLRELFVRLVGSVNAHKAELNLLYRESATLATNFRSYFRELEREQRRVIAETVAEGARIGQFAEVQSELFAHNMLMVAHSWALKSWALEDGPGLNEFIEREFELLTHGLHSSSLSRGTPAP